MLSTAILTEIPGLGQKASGPFCPLYCLLILLKREWLLNDIYTTTQDFVLTF